MHPSVVVTSRVVSSAPGCQQRLGLLIRQVNVSLAFRRSHPFSALQPGPMKGELVTLDILSEAIRITLDNRSNSNLPEEKSPCGHEYTIDVKQRASWTVVVMIKGASRGIPPGFHLLPTLVASTLPTPLTLAFTHKGRSNEIKPRGFRFKSLVHIGSGRS